EISIEFSKDTVFLSCKHAVHYDCIDNPRKKYPTCPSSEGLETLESSEAQKNVLGRFSKENESDMSTEKSISKNAKQPKKSVDRDKSPTLQRLIKELSTTIPGTKKFCRPNPLLKLT